MTDPTEDVPSDRPARRSDHDFNLGTDGAGVSPSHPELICDRIAEFRYGANGRMTLVIEFMSYARKNAIERLLEYVVLLRSKLLKTSKRRAVAALLVNLTGPPSEPKLSIGFPSKEALVGLQFRIACRNLRDDDAEATLDAIERRDLTAAVLP